MEVEPQSFDICIVCALYEEANAVIDEFSARCGVTFTSAFRNLNRLEYRHATIQNQRGEPLTVFVTWLSDMGPIRTALDLGPLWHEIHPRFVAMTGVCAGDRRKVKRGDLIVPTDAYHPDEGKITKEADRQPIHQTAMRTAGMTTQVLQYVRGFGSWKVPVYELRRQQLKRPWKATDEPSCHIEVMASTMSVRADNPFPQLTVQYHRKTVGIDMEAASFYTAMRDFPLLHGLVVKGVSDYGDTTKNDRARDFARRASAVYLLHFIQDYVTEETFPRPEIQLSESRTATNREQLQIAEFQAGIAVNIYSDRQSMIVARQQYLAYICQQYHSIVMLIGNKATQIPFDPIFQPLKLLQNPLAAEDLHANERRLFLDESYNKYLSNSQNIKTKNVTGLNTTIIALDGEDALNKSAQKRIVILGGPGTGKTTVLKSLFLKYVQHALEDDSFIAPLPIFVSLAVFARSKKSFPDYLAEIMTNIGVKGGEKDLLWQAIRLGQAFICLDGLDEVNLSHRTDIIKVINTLTTDTKNLWVVGSRFTDYVGGQLRHEQFTEWELLPLNRESRISLATSLFSTLAQQFNEKSFTDSIDPLKFVDALDQHPRASAWGKNPLFFTLTAIVFKQTGQLPRSQTDLYSKVIDSVLKMQEPDPIRRKVLRRRLARLALWNHERNDRTFTLDNLVTFFLETQNVLTPEDASDIVRSIIRSELIETVASETYGFQHQMFQEYFASVELAQQLVSGDPEIQNAAWNLVQRKYTYSRWVEVLRLHVGILAQEHGSKGSIAAKRWLSRLIEQALHPEKDPGNLGLVLAVKTLSEIDMEDVGQRVIQIWCKELVKNSKTRNSRHKQHLLDLTYDICKLSTESALVAKNLLVAELSEKNEFIRAIAIEALGKLENHIPGEIIAGALRDNSIWVRFAAIAAIQEMGERAPIESLLKAAFTDSEQLVYMQAVDAIDHLKALVPIDVVLNAIVDTRSRVRQVAVRVLGKLQNPLFLGTIYDCLLDDNQRVRAAAIWALEDFSKQHPVDIKLIEAMLNDEGSHVRFAAVRVLGQFRMQSSLDKIIEALEDEDEDVRTEAVYTLSSFGECAPIELLLKTLNETDDIAMRKVLIETLGELSTFVSPEPIIAALDDWDTRDVAIEALSKFGKRAPLVKLFDALHNNNGGTRETAAGALRSLKDYLSEEQIISELSTHVKQSRVAAVHILGELEEDAPLDLLLEALNDKDPLVRMAAMQVMTQLGKYLSPEIINLFLAHPHPAYQGIVTSALRKTDAYTHMDQISKMLVNEDIRVRLETLESLERQAKNLSSDKTIVNAILSTLGDEDAHVRRLAIRVLYNFNKYTQLDQHKIDHIMMALEDQDWFVRWKLLDTWGESISRERLLSAFDKDESVRMIILSILKRTQEGIPFETLQEALRDKNDEIRSAAVEYLEKLGDNIPLQFVLAAMRDKSALVRAAAVQVAGNLGEKAPLQEILAMRDDNDEYVCYQAKKSALKLGKYLGWDTFFDSEDPLARCIAIQVLGEAKEEKFPGQFRAAMKDENADVRAAAVEAMGKLGDLALQEGILKALLDNDGYVRKIALETINTLKISTPANLLLTILENEDAEYRIRVVAIEKLGDIMDIRALEYLLSAMGSKDREVRRAAIKALKKLREYIPVEQFVAFLYDPDEYIRKTTVEILDKLDDGDIIEHLILLLGDSNGEVCSAALKLLRNTYPQEVIEEARLTLQGGKSKPILESVHQGFIAETLGNIGLASYGLLKKLTDLLEWPHWQVQVKAAQALGKIHRNISGDAIRKLYELRCVPYPEPVQQAANEALSNILSLESIEEDGF